jgi:hypothetical protein
MLCQVRGDSSEPGVRALLEIWRNRAREGSIIVLVVVRIIVVIKDVVSPKKTRQATETSGHETKDRCLLAWTINTG